MEQKAFLFYLNWKDQIDDLDDIELRRFIHNLIKYHSGEEIDLPTKIDRLAWNGILPGLEANQDKYEKRVQANRENGKLGGAPKGNQNASKEKTTQINPEQTKQPDKREQINDNSKMEIENRKKINENREELNEKGKLETGNKQMETEKSKSENKTEIPVNAGLSSNNSKHYGGMSMFEYNKQRKFS
ncbi:MAG: DUF6291 domain-containing protein [Prolixibacteraceae bacterium]|nr:DUF6291 domain-containing protein [Prolixibacteraceae bacterium]